MNDVPLFSIVAANIRTGQRRVIASNKSGAEAREIAMLAIADRDHDDEFFIVEVVGTTATVPEQ